MLGVIIKYSEFYGESIPENPLELIKNIPKNELLITISIQELEQSLSDNSIDFF